MTVSPMANGACSVRIVAPVARPDDVVVPVGAVVGGKVVVVAERGDAEAGLGPVDLAMGDIVILEYHSLATKVGIYTLLLLPLPSFSVNMAVSPAANAAAAQALVQSFARVALQLRAEAVAL